MQLSPDCEVQICCRNEGRGDSSVRVFWQGRTDAQGLVTVNLPPDAPLSYEGSLFRVLWEVQWQGQTARLWVGDGPVKPDPYAALGLAFNPFRAEDIPVQQMDWEGVLPQHWLERGHSQAPEPGRGELVQLLGVKGAGKSSHLAHWRAQQPGPAHYYPPQGRERWKPPPVAPICYWDEACRMPTPLLHWGLWRASRAGHTVCVGTHRDLSKEATRYGLSVRTIHLQGITSGEVLAWAAKRIESAQLTPGGQFRIPLPLAEEVTELCGGSWREIATRLHIWTAQQALALASTELV